MKESEPFVLAVAALIALAAFAIPVASAAELNTYTESEVVMLTTGSTIAASAEGATTLKSLIGSISCEESAVEGTTGNTGGAGEAVNGSISTLTFSKCNATVTVLKKGSLSIKTSGENLTGNGVLSSTGTEVTVSYLGLHCIFSTNNTSIATLTGSQATEGNATLDIGATIPRTGGSSGAFCGSTANWTGSYEVTNPSTLTVGGICQPKTNGKYTGPVDCLFNRNVMKGVGTWEQIIVP